MTEEEMNDIDLMEDKQLDMEEKYYFMYDKYMKLYNKYKKLNKEFSENTIIQSMNDMKERYEQLERESISIYMYEELEKKYNKQNKVINAVSTILENTSNRLRKLDNFLLIDKQKELYRCEIELAIIYELLEQLQ
jgi:hypothetical protein